MLQGENFKDFMFSTRLKHKMCRLDEKIDAAVVVFSLAFASLNAKLR